MDRQDIAKYGELLGTNFDLSAENSANSVQIHTVAGSTPWLIEAGDVLRHQGGLRFRSNRGYEQYRQLTGQTQMDAPAG